MSNPSPRSPRSSPAPGAGELRNCQPTEAPGIHTIHRTDAVATVAELGALLDWTTPAT